MGFLVGGRDWDAVTQRWGLALAAGSVAALYQQQLNTKGGYSVGFPWGCCSSSVPKHLLSSDIPAFPAALSKGALLACPPVSQKLWDDDSVDP